MRRDLVSLWVVFKFRSPEDFESKFGKNASKFIETSRLVRETIGKSHVITVQIPGKGIQTSRGLGPIPKFHEQFSKDSSPRLRRSHPNLLGSQHIMWDMGSNFVWSQSKLSDISSKSHELLGPLSRIQGQIQCDLNQNLWRGLQISWDSGPENESNGQKWLALVKILAEQTTSYEISWELSENRGQSSPVLSPNLSRTQTNFERSPSHSVRYTGQSRVNSVQVSQELTLRSWVLRPFCEKQGQTSGDLSPNLRRTHPKLLDL